MAGGLGVAASIAASAATGALPPLPTVTVTTPLATATVAVPPPPTVTATVEVPPVTTVAATVAAPPPPPVMQTVASAVTGAAAPVGSAAAGVAGSVAPAPASSSSAATAGAATAASPPGGGETGVTTTSTAPPTAARTAAAPALRARRAPGRLGMRRLVLTLNRPRELTLLFRGPGETCRVAGRVVVHGRRGTNVVPLNGRVRGGRLAPGRFRVEVLDTTGSAQRLLGRLAVTLRYDVRGRARVRQVRYVPRDCPLGVSALLASSARVAGERAATAAPVAQPTARRAPPSPRPVHADPEEGGLAAIPDLVPGDAVGGLTAVILVGLLLLSAGGFLLVAGGSARRALRR